MLKVPLVNSQIMPPKIKNSIRRDRLIDFGMSIRNHHVSYVVAPAGYGKSVWISSLIDEPGWPRTAWLSLENHDAEMSFFIVHIIYSVKKIVPHFGEKVVHTVNSLEDIRRDWIIAADTMIEEFTAQGETIIVFDDFHIIDGNDTICKFVEYLIYWLPEHIHIVIVSRNKSTLNLSREQIKGQLLEITGRELKFNQQETERLFYEMNLNLDHEMIEVIQSITEGWAAALRLFVLLLLQSDQDAKNTLSIIMKKETILYKYLSNELFSYFSGYYSEFLLDISLLPYIEPGLCNASLEIINSENLINELHSLGLLSISGEENSIWKLHQLIGEFLQTEVITLHSKEHVREVRKRAAAYLKKLGNTNLAIDLLLTNKDFHAASELIKAQGDDYFLQLGRMDSLNSKINCLPTNIVKKDQWLLFYFGMSILHVNQEQSVEVFSKAADIAYKRNDTKCVLRSLLAVIPVYTFSNNLKKLKETSEKINNAAALCRDAWSKNIVLVGEMGNLVWSDNIKKGLELCAKVDKSSLDSESRMQFLFASSMLLYRQGNLSSAREKIKEALELTYVKENERWTGTALAIYAFICMLSGEHKKLKEILEEMICIGEKYNIPHQIGLAYRRKAQLL